MKRVFIPAMLIASIMLTTSCGDNTDVKTEDTKEAAIDSNDEKFEDNKMDQDRDFAVEAASGGMLEVELGKLTATNATSAEVKKFGQQMVTDHTKANDEMKALAATKNITLPPAPGEDHQKKIDDLKTKMGSDFDKAYVDLMVDDHEKDVKDFEKEASDGKDPEIKAFASGKLSTLKHHLDMTKSIKEKMK